MLVFFLPLYIEKIMPYSKFSSKSRCVYLTLIIYFFIYFTVTLLIKFILSKSPCKYRRRIKEKGIWKGYHAFATGDTFENLLQNYNSFFDYSCLDEEAGVALGLRLSSAGFLYFVYFWIRYTDFYVSTFLKICKLILILFDIIIWIYLRIKLTNKFYEAILVTILFEMRCNAIFVLITSFIIDVFWAHGIISSIIILFLIIVSFKGID